jgi:hypothetical protein
MRINYLHKLARTMSENNQNRVRFYLDQNVIDYLIKGNLDDVQDLINKTPNSEIIYSYVTLREFERIEDVSHRKLYLDYLKRFKAKYFWIDKNEILHFEGVDPFEKFDEYNSRRTIYDEDPMIQMVHKILGGEKGISFDEIATSNKISFSHLMEYVNTTLDFVPEHPAINKEFLKNILKNGNSSYADSINILTQQINNANYNFENPINDLRKLSGIKVDKLNEIEPPNVIDQIWDIIKDGINNTNSDLSYNDFGDGFKKFYPNQKVTMTMKVIGLYNFLNSIGYYPDKNIRSDKKFIPFINDHQHVGYAIYSNFFITRDKRLMKKAEAVYEHLKIRTKIYFIE